MKPFLKIPPLFWANSVFGVLWFAMEAFNYVMILLKVIYYIELISLEQHQ